MYSSIHNVNILTAMLVAHGVKHIVVCPGSRNAPLIHNFNECPDFTCHLITDERSAGFVALGISGQADENVAVCVTSGSALLNLAPSVAEATYQHKGFIIISADRPTEWIGQMDGQTLPQVGALGNFVGISVQLPEIQTKDDKLKIWHCERLINEAMLSINKAPHPCVHINIPINEPLFHFNSHNLPSVNVVKRKEWHQQITKSFLTEQFIKAKRPLIVIGQTPRNAISDDVLKDLSNKITIFSEPLSNNVLSHSLIDEMLISIEEDDEKYQPDLVLYAGGHTVSKRLRIFLRTTAKPAQHVLISEDGKLRDISQQTSIVIDGNTGEIINEINRGLNEANYLPKEYYFYWEKLHEQIANKNKRYQPPFSSMLAVKLFEQMLQKEDCPTVHYANSSSIRLASIYAQHFCFCNRGVNGIEGSLSVAVGASLANTNKKTYCVIGDLSFFYDENALWTEEVRGNLRIMLLNNKQGGIFRQLKGLENSPARDSLVSARHSTTAEGICKQFGVRYIKADNVLSLETGLNDLINSTTEFPVLLEVITDIDNDERALKDYYKFIKT